MKLAVLKLVLVALPMAAVTLGCSLVRPVEWSCSSDGQEAALKLEKLLSERLRPVSAHAETGCDSGVEAGVQTYFAPPVPELLRRLRSSGCTAAQEVKGDSGLTHRSVCFMDDVWFLAEIDPRLGWYKNDREAVDAWFTPVKPPQRFSD